MEAFMKFSNPFRDLSRFELGLYVVSVTAVLLSFIFSGSGDVLTLISSLIGVTALIFLAKGYVIGQVLIVVFSVFYGIISFFFGYYGEMITYLGMTAPIAVVTLISWMRHPFEGTKEVEVSRLDAGQLTSMLLLSVIVTVVFYFILKALGNANLLFSTISVTTSFIASYLTFLRSPYYALGYAANDLVLIVLWVLASVSDASYVPMVVCFVMFFANDLYGFYSWIKMQKRQSVSGK